MKTPREQNASGNDTNFNNQHLPEKNGKRNNSGYNSDTDDHQTGEPDKEQHSSFFSRIDTSFPLSGGETDEDLYKVLHSDESNDEFKRTPKDTIELSDADLDVDNDDYLLNDGE